MKKNLFFTILIFLLAFAVSLPAAQLLLLKGKTWNADIPQSLIDQNADCLLNALNDCSIACDILSQEELTAAALADKRVLLLPCNGPLTAEQQQAVFDFTARGGKLLAFACEDTKIQKLLGISNLVAIPTAKLPLTTKIILTEHAWPGAPGNFYATCKIIYRFSDNSSAKRVGWFLTQKQVQTSDPIVAIAINANGMFWTTHYTDQDKLNGRAALYSWLADTMPELWSPLIKRQEDAWSKNLELVRSFSEIYTKLNGKDQWRQAWLIRRDISENKNAAPDVVFHELNRANELLRQAYTMSCQGTTKEMRGIWLHYPQIYPEWDWNKYFNDLTDNGFNTVFPNFASPATSAPAGDASTPAEENSSEDIDEIQACLDACHKYNVGMHIWKTIWTMPSTLQEDTVKQLLTDQRATQTNVNGTQTFLLAPYLLENQDMEIASCIDLALNYNIHGINLDFSYTPGPEDDFSPAARTAFEKYLGQTVESWPKDCQKGQKFWKQYNEWRVNLLTDFTRRLSRELLLVAPNLKLSLTVRDDWDQARINSAMDIKTWCSEGLLDFICPLNSKSSLTEFTELMDRQINEIGEYQPVYVGVNTELQQDAADCIRQLEIINNHKGNGFVIFQSSPFTTEQLLPRCKQGLTSESSDFLPHNTRRRAPKFAEEITLTPLPKILKSKATIKQEIKLPNDMTFSTIKVELWKDGLVAVFQEEISPRKNNVLKLNRKVKDRGYYRWRVIAENADGTVLKFWDSQAFIIK